MLVVYSLLVLAALPSTHAFLNWHPHVAEQDLTNPTYDEETLALQQQFRETERPPIVWVPGPSTPAAIALIA
jgi:hypothetical protein